MLIRVKCTPLNSKSLVVLNFTLFCSPHFELDFLFDHGKIGIVDYVSNSNQL